MDKQIDRATDAARERELERKRKLNAEYGKFGRNPENDKSDSESVEKSMQDRLGYENWKEGWSE